MATAGLGIPLEIGPDDVTVLQVNGVPVLVNPESMLNLEPNQMATAGLGIPLEIGPDDISVIQ